MSNNPSPAIAALLSFLFPGAGQIYAGHPRRGVLMAIPMALFVIGVVLVLNGTINAIGLVTNTQSIAVLLVLNIAFVCYHLAAMLDAYNLAQRERRQNGYQTPRSAPAALIVLTVLTLFLHGTAEAAGVWGGNALAELLPGDPNAIPSASFAPEPTTEPTTTPSASPMPTSTAGGSPSPTSAPTASPTAPTSYPPIDPNWAPAQDGRLNVLLIGADAGRGRTSLRTDTMMLLSVDIESGKAALFGFPRNLIGVPLPAESKGAYPGGVFPEMISALWRFAAQQPNSFVGSEGIGSECQFDFECQRGWRAITGALQELSGVPIDGFAAVDFRGFITLVDTVGGVWVDVPARVVDDDYPDPDRGRIEIEIEPGCQFFNGNEALAYARSRQQDSDYRRMQRQQTVLKAVRRQFDPIAMIPQVPSLLQAAQDNLYTTFSQNDIQNLALIADRVDVDRLYQVRFTPNQVARIGGIGEIRTRVRNIFEEPEPTPRPTPSGRPQPCPPPG